MQEYKVIAKRKYLHNQNNKLLLVKEYSIIEKDDRRYLVLKLFNNTNQTLTRFDFTIVQKSLDGDYIATNEYKKNSVECNPMTSFVPEVSIEISKDCEDISVELKNAVFETFLYDNGKKYTISAIGGRKIEANDNVVSKKFVSKLPFVAVIVFLLMAALILTATYYGVVDFIKDKTEFNIDDFTFSYTTDKRDDDSPIYVQKYLGRTPSVRIPAKIKNHKVEYIGEEAFKDNTYVENISIESDIIINKAAFQNCVNLKTINFDKVRFISDEAFKSSGIEDFTTTKTMHIGEKAFLDCKNLKTVNIDNKEEKVEIFDKAFYLCSGLKNLILPNEYEIGQDVFKGCHGLEKIDVKEYSYLTKESKNLKGVFCLNNQDRTLEENLKDLHINHMEEIPESFVENFKALTNLKVNVVKELAIPDYAFKGCKKLENLELPLGIKKVGLSSFEDCGMQVFNASNVESIGANAFKNCVNLMEFNLTNKVTTLKEGTFSGCEKLTKINIPKKVVSLPNDIFSNCKSLTEIKIYPDSSIVSLGANAFKGCSSLVTFTIPKTVSILGESLFESCTSLQNVTMLNSYDEIPAGMFKNCEQLVNFTDLITPNLTKIHEGAFSGCKQLMAVDLPGNITSIDIETFSNCENLNTVNFANDNCSEILRGAFSGCKSLKYIDLPQSITRIGAEAFSGCGFSDICFNNIIEIGDKAYSNCENLKSFIIENEESKVGYEVLKDCRNLENLYLPYIHNKLIGQDKTIHTLFNNADKNSIPASLNKITIASQQVFAENCFANCSGVVNFVLPNATVLENQAFANCTNLTSFDFINTITDIGFECFLNCKQLTDINIQNHGAYLYSSAFKGCDAISSLTIPDTSSILGLFDMVVVPESLQKITVYSTNVTLSLFDKCEKVREINLPSVVYIDAYAFSTCKGLKDIYLAEGLNTIGNYAFRDCLSLETLVIPSSVTSIGYDVFDGCNNLYEIVNKSCVASGADKYIISEVSNEADKLSVLQNGKYKFAIKDGIYYLVNCALEEGEQLELPTFIDSYIIKKSLFMNKRLNQQIVIPNCVEEIQEYAFHSAYLTGLEFEGNSKLKVIGGHAFVNNLIEKLDFNNGIETIGEQAFINCEKIQSVTLPMTLKVIGDSAFYNCPNLYELYNNSSLTIQPGSIDNGYIAREVIEVNSPVNFVTINGCKFACTLNKCELIEFNGYNSEDSCLKNGVLTLPKTVVCNGKEYKNYDIKRYVFYYNNEIQEVIIPSAVTNIKESAFSLMYYLKKVTFEENSKLQYLGKYSFYQNTNLVEVNIPDGVKVIDDSAFSTDYKLRRIRIPRSIEKIGDYAFLDCNDLKEVLNLSSLPITAGSENYGMVAKNAMFINNTEIPYITYYEDDIYSVWAIKGACEIRDINFNYADCKELHLPESFVVEGKKYDKYTIRDGAFNYSWVRINKLFIPKALQSFNKNTFKYEENGMLTAKIQEIIFSEDSLINIIEEEAFSNISDLRNIKLPLNIREIGRRAFYNCTNLNTHIELEKLYKLNEEAFANCNSLQSFALPKTIKVIQNNVFAGCNRLVYIENKSDFALVRGKDGCGQIAMNAVYISGNYDKDPVIKRFTVRGKNDFKILGINGIAFIEGIVNPGYKLLEIPSEIIDGENKYNTVQILPFSLEKASACTEIYIPKNVTKIECGALPSNAVLKKIYYQGTKAEWDKILIEDKIITNIEPQYNSVIKNGVIVEQNNGKKDPVEDVEPVKNSIMYVNNSIYANDGFDKVNKYSVNRQSYEQISFVG